MIDNLRYRKDPQVTLIPFEFTGRDMQRTTDEGMIQIELKTAMSFLENQR